MSLKNMILDRDGTIIEDKHYLADPDQVALLPFVGETLKLFKDEGWRFFVVSNQSGVGRGFFSEDTVQACMERMCTLLNSCGVDITGVVYCVHDPLAGCACRKPAQGMWEMLQLKYTLDPAESVMVGDKAEDMAFAARAGLAHRILVASGKGFDHAQKLGLPAVEKGEYVRIQPVENICPTIYAKDFLGVGKALLNNVKGAV